MALIDKLLGKLIHQGQLTVIMPGGEPHVFGPGGGQSLTVRVADGKTAFAIARNPRLGLGEAYMDGKVTVENGDILDLMRLVVGANPWEGSAYLCSDPERIRSFSSIVFAAGISAPVRTPRGRDIDAACGQLKTAAEKKSRAQRDREAVG